MNVINNYNRTVRVRITRSDVDIIFEQTLDSLLSFPYRFMPNIEYEIIILERNNDTILDTRTVNLTKNGQIEDFGFYKQRFPDYPDFNQSNLTLSIIIIIVIGSSIIGVVVFIANKYRKRVINLKEKEKQKINFEVKKYKNFLDLD